MRTEDAMNHFLQERRGTRAPATLEQDEWAIRKLMEVCSTLPASPADVASALGAPGLAAESRFDVWTCLRKFLRWVEERHALPNPCAGMAAPPRHKTERRVFSPKEIDRLYQTATTERDRLLVLVPLDTGLRLGEIAGLRREDVKDTTVSVRGKVGHRQPPVSPELRDRLWALAPRGPLWRGRKGALSLSGVQQVYKRLLEQAEIEGPKMGPHALRHTFATNYIRSGGGVRQLQHILGHEKIETTMIYVSLAAADVEEDHQQHSPARKLGYLAMSDQKKVPANPGPNQRREVSADLSGVMLSAERLDVGQDDHGIYVRLTARFDTHEDLDGYIAALQEQRDRLRGDPDA